MQRPDTQPENPSPSAPRRRLGPVAWAGIALGGVVVIAALAFGSLRLTGLRKSPVPTPACVESTLTLGGARYRIEPVKAPADGSLPDAKDAADVAYWVQGSDVNTVFVLAGAPANVALKEALKQGDEAKIVWANCNSTSYVLAEPESRSAGDPALLDQSASGITVVVPDSPAGGGWAARGELAGETLTAIDTPAPGSIQAEIGLLGSQTSADGKSVTIEVSVANVGPDPFTVRKDDVSLTSQGGEPVPPDSAEPALPRKVAAGATETLRFTFPRPDSGTAVFRLFDTEYDVEGS